MTAATQPLEAGHVDLPSLVGDLRARGFCVGVGEVVMAERLLQRLELAAGATPDARRLASFVGPVFCRTPEEQRDFPSIFERHVIRERSAPAAVLRPDAETRPSSREPMPRGRLPPGFAKHALRVASSVAAIALIAWGAGPLLRSLLGLGGNGGGEIGPLPEPLPVVEWPLRYLLGPAAIVAAMVAAWVVLRRRERRRRAALSRQLFRERQHLAVAHVQGAGKPLYDARAIHRVQRALPLHRTEPAETLDARATVERTIGNGGAFTPVHGTRRVQRGYVALLDRAGARDQQAQLVSALLDRLAEQRPDVARYEFSGDPRLCRAAGALDRPLSLGEILARHPGATLLIFSDGFSFLSSVTGEPAGWVRELDHWESRLLVRLGASDPHRDAVLTGSGLVLTTLVEFPEAVRALGAGDEVAARGGTRTAFPDALLRDSVRWLDRVPPGEDEIEELRVQLFRYLGEERFTFLCSCALYPELDFALTLSLAANLHPGTDAGALLQPLMDLPWFRRGYMPEWLRERLVAELLPSERRRALKELERLLRTALSARTPGSFPLRAVVHGGANQDVLTRENPDSSSGTGDPGRPLRVFDEVTLSFVAENQGLSLSVPEEVLTAFAPDQQSEWIGRIDWGMLATGWVIVIGGVCMLLADEPALAFLYLAINWLFAEMVIRPLRQLDHVPSTPADAAREKDPRPV